MMPNQTTKKKLSLDKQNKKIFNPDIYLNKR